MIDVCKTRFIDQDFKNVEDLMKFSKSLPMIRTRRLAEFKELHAFSNARDFQFVYADKRLYQVSSDRYDVVPHSVVIENIVSIFAELGLEDCDGRMASWNYGGRMWITMQMPKKMDFEPIQGDTYRYGFHFWNSLDGSSGIGVAFSPIRILCLNQMVIWKKELAIKHKHMGMPSLKDWLTKAIKEITFKSKDFQGLIQEAQTHRLEGDLKAVVERLSLGPRITEHVMRNMSPISLADAAGSITAYDVINALTRYATHELRVHPMRQIPIWNLTERLLMKPELIAK